MKITNLEQIKPLNNQVLIRPLKDNDQYLCKDGKTKLYVDTTYHPEYHTCVIGEVISTPVNLIYNKKNQETMEWKTEIEIQKGDIVYYDIYWAVNSLTTMNPRWVEQDGKKYIFIPYQDLILAKRNNEIIMLNGYCLVEPIDKDFNTNIIIPDMMKGHDEIRGKVAKIGSCNTEYINKIYSDDKNVKEGDFIIMDKCCDIEVEYDLHRTLDKKYWRVQRRNMICVIKNN